MGSSFLRTEIRGVLTRHRIDLSCLQIGVYGNTVRLLGILKRSHGQPDLSFEALENLEKDARRIRGIRRLEFLFSNWRREADGWVEFAIEPIPYGEESGPARA